MMRMHIQFYNSGQKLHLTCMLAYEDFFFFCWSQKRPDMPNNIKTWILQEKSNS